MHLSEVTPKIHPNISKAARQYFTNSSFTTSQFRFAEAIKKFGWREVGEGQSSTVYANPKKSYVMKVTNHPDEGFAAYVSLIKRNPNSHFPKISNMKRFKVNGGVYYIYLIEKLHKIPDRQAKRYTDWLEVYLSSDLKNYSLADLFYNRIPKIFTPEMIKALNVIIRYSDKYRIWLDIHENNIMSRKDGTIVITDPYV